MASPTTRNEFKEYCLRRLGKPVITINVDDTQVEDRVDDALKYFYDYHFEGTEKQYYKVQITSTDKTNGYITLPDNIIGAVRIFDISSMSNIGNMFDVRYQIALNDLYTLTSHSLVPYFMTMQHIAMIEQLLIGHKPIRYNRHVNKLYIDMNWANYADGTWIIVEAYKIVDPAVFPEVWGDRWLQQYATALVKRQWGENIKKFSGMQMPGGMSFNGQQIFDEAVEEIARMEAEMLNSFSLPVGMIMG